MPTLLHINSAKNCGSTGKIAEQISQIAHSDGWRTFVAHGFRYNRGGEIESFPITGKYGEYVHLLKSFFSDAQGLGSVDGTRELVKWMDDIKPDIVHLHNIHGYYLNYRILFEYLASKEIPVVWTLHDCWPFTGHCTYFDYIKCEKWISKCEHCPQKSTYPKSLIDRSSRNFVLKRKLFTAIPNMTIVPVSDWLHRLVAQSFLSGYPIRTIHNGIDLDVFRPRESNFRKCYDLEEQIVILGVADGFGQRKGLLDFNLLSDKLSKEYKIVLVGLRESDRKCISSNIIGFGRTANQQELADIYSAADIFVNPTYEDNFPTTNLEALACGTPVITYQTGGSPEAVDDNTGLVVRKGDIDGLICAIKAMGGKGKSAYSQACRERAVNCFNKNDRFEEYVQLYNTLINR